MYISIIIALAMVITIAIPVSTVLATAQAPEGKNRDIESGFYNEDGYVPSKENRPAINPDFNPDEECQLDAFQLKCIPGAEQDCPTADGFGQNEDETYIPIGDCPEGYHEEDDDETGQCYPNSEGCDAYTIKDGVRYNFVLVEGEDGESDRCADPAYLCNEDSSHEICKEYLEDNN